MCIKKSHAFVLSKIISYERKKRARYPLVSIFQQVSNLSLLLQLFRQNMSSSQQQQQQQQRRRLYQTNQQSRNTNAYFDRQYWNDKYSYSNRNFY